MLTDYHRERGTTIITGRSVSDLRIEGSEVTGVNLDDGSVVECRTRCALPGPQAQLPIVALTANASRDDRGRCLAAGMDDHVAKPFEADQVVDVILRSMKRGARNPAHETGIRREPHE